MASNFYRWEKDPFFYAAEEIQVSSDRMESAYRLWIRKTKDSSNLFELRREVHTSLGTAKWQLEEFERAVRSSYTSGKSDDAKTRHQQFITAIKDKILMVEKSLSGSEEEVSKISWVQLDENERDELELFLSSSLMNATNDDVINGKIKEEQSSPLIFKETMPYCAKNSTEKSIVESQEDNICEHKVTETYYNGDWRILIGEENIQQHPPFQGFSFSALMRGIESTSNLMWSNATIRKWKGKYQHQLLDNELLQSPQLSQRIHSCYERSKSCVNGYSDTYYNKQLNGWLGTAQRQLQRSQYLVQYNRPIQVIIWVFLFISMIVFFVIRYYQRS